MGDTAARDFRRILGQEQECGAAALNAGAKPQCGRRESHDLDHYEAQPGDWSVTVTQLSPGGFGSEIDYVQFPGLTAYRNHWNCGTRVAGQTPEGALFLGTDISPETSDIHWCGKKTLLQRFACAPGGADVNFTVTPGARNVVLLMSADLIGDLLPEQCLDTIRNSRHLDLTPSSGESLVAELVRIIEAFAKRPDLIDNPLFAGDAFSRLLQRLEHESNPTAGRQDSLSCNRRDEAVHNAMLFADEQSGMTSAFNMAQAAGVSQRPMEFDFRDRLGTSPGKYLQILRLNQAHHTLADAAPGEVSILEVAERWGFTHLGRFGKAYKSLFGERPSDTLRFAH